MNMPVEMEDRAFRNYLVHRLIKESEYEFTARLTIRNISSEENDKNHQIIINTKLSPNTPELNIVQDFDVQVHNTQVLIFIHCITSNIHCPVTRLVYFLFPNQRQGQALL